MATGAHFGCPKFTFDPISGHFRSIRNLIFFGKFLFLRMFFYKMAAGGHFGCQKITLGRISGHFRSIRNFFLKLFYKMAAVGHFECPKFTLDHKAILINTDFLIFFWIFFTKWLPVTILDVRKSLSMSFLSISHRYATLIFL